MIDISRGAIEVLGGHLSSQGRWSVVLDDTRYYRDDRAALHQAIIAEALVGTVARDVPTALVIAGGPASGKSTLLETLVLPPEAVHLNADSIKESLPEYKLLSDAGNSQAAYVVHEESSDIARALLEASVEGRRNLVMDVVGNAEPGDFVGKLEVLREAGYAIRIVYVDVAVDVAVVRAAGRQRVVPETKVRELHRKVAERFSEVEALDWLESLSLYSTDGVPELFAERGTDGSLVARNAARLKVFREKANA